MCRLNWVSNLDREYLEDYEQKEIDEFERLVRRKIQDGQFSFERDKYPPKERFEKLQKPVALASSHSSLKENIWGQVPFSGSLILLLPPCTKRDFETYFFKMSEIPEIVDFIKKTGKLQVALYANPKMYAGLEYLNPFFELNPPVYSMTPLSVFGNKCEITDAGKIFDAIPHFREILHVAYPSAPLDLFSLRLEKTIETYIVLKLGHYSVVKDVEEIMMIRPLEADMLLSFCKSFIVDPLRDMRSKLRNLTLEELRSAVDILPFLYQPKKMRFPCEIGKFLLKKLTYAAQDMRACNYLVDNYKAYDLQKVQESLNEAIVTNHPDIVTKEAKELYEILGNVWDDKTIPRRIENIKIGVQVSIAAVGGVAGGITGGLLGGPEGAVIGGTAGVGIGDFLTRLGFKVGEKAVEKFFSVKGEELTERLAKLRTRSYQANVYGFKKKYKNRIVQP